MNDSKHAYKVGAFPGTIDPFAEHPHYFQSIHAGMIGRLLTQLADILWEKGYVAGRETSLQIVEMSKPDIFVHRQSPVSASRPGLDYQGMALEMLADPGVEVADIPELEAIHIHDRDSGNLVTAIEIVSQSNKSRDIDIRTYQLRREQVYLANGVNVLEIDFTRSVKRLVMNTITRKSPYHIAVFLPGELLRVIPVTYGESLPRIALPLRYDAVPIECQDAYEFAYQQVMTAWHIQQSGHYTMDYLPFPSTLTDEQRRNIEETVGIWQTKLKTS